VLKRALIAGTFLGAGLFTVAAAALFGVLLGNRALVVSADAVRPTAIATVAPPAPSAASGPVLLAARETVAR
jgi:hypothetical protein